MFKLHGLGCLHHAPLCLCEHFLNLSLGEHFIHWFAEQHQPRTRLCSTKTIRVGDDLQQGQIMAIEVERCMFLFLQGQ